MARLRVNSMCYRTHNCQQGFSLIETMVASFILVILVGIILGATLHIRSIFDTSDIAAILQAESRKVISDRLGVLHRLTANHIAIGDGPIRRIIGHPLPVPVSIPIREPWWQCQNTRRAVAIQYPPAQFPAIVLRPGWNWSPGPQAFSQILVAVPRCNMTFRPAHRGKRIE